MLPMLTSVDLLTGNPPIPPVGGQHGLLPRVDRLSGPSGTAANPSETELLRCQLSATQKQVSKLKAEVQRLYRLLRK